MPHQCTTCDRHFPDGSKEMLTGCPECGGNKFQFIPQSAIEDDREAPADPAPEAESPAAADDILEASEPVGEDTAQASARSAVVSADELPDDETADSADAGTDDSPDMEELRRELDDQFESIKILQPGEYELNLMELYDRPEYIIALEEDGRYVIDVPTESPTE